jgi:hypothetical protein
MIAAGLLAIVLAVVALATVVSLVTFFTVGGPFGFLNDAGNALIGLLSAALAILLISQAGGWTAAAAAVIGAALTMWGSWLVMSGTTGFVLAGFVSTAGFGFIGLWLALVAWEPTAEALFGPLLTVARIAAVAMIIGALAAIPAGLMRIDSYESMPGWVWLFSIGWLGVYVLFPVVTFGLGRNLIGDRPAVAADERSGGADGTRPATVDDIHEIALSLPGATRYDTGGKPGPIVYQVSRRSCKPRVGSAACRASAWQSTATYRQTSCWRRRVTSPSGAPIGGPTSTLSISGSTRWATRGPR